jgi:hypothetical protein
MVLFILCFLLVELSLARFLPCQGKRKQALLESNLSGISLVAD